MSRLIILFILYTSFIKLVVKCNYLLEISILNIAFITVIIECDLGALQYIDKEDKLVVLISFKIKLSIKTYFWLQNVQVHDSGFC